MEIKVSSASIVPCTIFFSWHTTLCWTASNLQHKHADDLVLVFSFTHSGREKKSTGQTDPSPRSGQTPQNEEEKGLPGKVRRHSPWTLCQDFYHCSALISFIFKMHLYHSTFFYVDFSLRVMFACSVCKFRSFYKEEMETHLESRFHKDHFKFLSGQLSKPTTDFLEVTQICEFFFFFFTET